MPAIRLVVAFALLSTTLVAQAELSFETAPNLAAAITDNGYSGTLASMTCVSIPVTGTGGYQVDALSVTAALDHTWIGDLVVKLVSPDNTVVTLMSRPGVAETVDDGSDSSGAGDSSNLAATYPVKFMSGATTSAEAMGSTLADSQVVCRDDAVCIYAPNHGAALAGDLTTFSGKLMAGTWKFCVGDAGTGDTGAIQQVRLTFAGATPALLQITPQTLDFRATVQGTTSDVRFVTLSNEGTLQLSVNTLTLAQPPFDRTTDGTCGNSLPRVIAGGSQCTLSYTFSPATQDVASQSFSITSDAAGDTGFTLQGSGDAVFVNGFEP